MIMYRVRSGKIYAVEVLRATDRQVVLANPHRIGGEEREKKESIWHSWHETWEAAHAHMIDEAQSKVNSLRKQLECANGDLGRIKGMKPPVNVESGRE
jgi:hypothetical protein